jgi:hypothetical protein
MLQKIVTNYATLFPCFATSKTLSEACKSFKQTKLALRLHYIGHAATSCKLKNLRIQTYLGFQIT